jgi:hypothetical protein
MISAEPIALNDVVVAEAIFAINEYVSDVVAKRESRVRMLLSRCRTSQVGASLGYRVPWRGHQNGFYDSHSAHTLGSVG